MGMEALVTFLFGAIVGWTVRSFVHIPEGHVFPGMRASAGPGGYHGSPRPLRGRIVSCTTEAASPPGVPPKAGFASDPLHHWCYMLAEGETAGDIAAAITGEEARYQELVLANPDVPKVGIPGKVGADEWNFAPGSLASDARLSLPQTWNPWVDELANARGQKTPFPEDNRRSPGTGTHGVPMLQQGMQPLSPPYGRIFSYSPPMQEVA